MIVYAPISVGELIDKITISKIKLTHIKEDTKLRNVKKELNELNNALNSLDLDVDITDETDRLQVINQQLWNVEDKIREKERLRQFDEFFIELLVVDPYPISTKKIELTDYIATLNVSKSK